MDVFRNISGFVTLDYEDEFANGIRRGNWSERPEEGVSFGIRQVFWIRCSNDYAGSDGNQRSLALRELEDKSGVYA